MDTVNTISDVTAIVSITYDIVCRTYVLCYIYQEESLPTLSLLLDDIIALERQFDTCHTKVHNLLLDRLGLHVACL